MKTITLLMKVGLCLSVACALMFVGASIESQYHFFGPQYSGLPKLELPPVGSTVYVDWSEGDVFVGRYAGKRLFYQSPTRRSGVSIALEGGKAYEVIEQKGQQKVLWPIKQ